MTALATFPRQIGLFDAPAEPTTKKCEGCGNHRALAQFKFIDKKAGVRSDICNTCRVGMIPAAQAAEAIGEEPAFKKVRKQAILDTPHTDAIDPQPSACWMTPGMVVPVFINNGLTGQVVIGYLHVVSVQDGEKLRKNKTYTPIRNRFVKRGYQIAEIRRSIAAPAIENTARHGRNDG